MGSARTELSLSQFTQAPSGTKCFPQDVEIHQIHFFFSISFTYGFLLLLQMIRRRKKVYSTKYKFQRDILTICNIWSQCFSALTVRSERMYTQDYEFGRFRAYPQPL